MCNPLPRAVWSELAVCYLGLGDDGKAIELFRKSYKLTKKTDSFHNYQLVLANIENVYLYRKDHLTAISYYWRALAFSTRGQRSGFNQEVDVRHR